VTALGTFAGGISAPVGLQLVERLSTAEFEQLSADEQSKHVQDTLAALRDSVPHSGADAGTFLDVRFYVQKLAGWSPAEVQRLWPWYRTEIERHAGDIHAAFQEALDSGSLDPAQAQYAKNCLQAAERLVELADEYI
jgi:hypothetical protein